MRPDEFQNLPSVDEFKTTQITVTMRHSDLVVIKYWFKSLYPVTERWCHSWDEADRLVRKLLAGDLAEGECLPDSWQRACP